MWRTCLSFHIHYITSSNSWNCLSQSMPSQPRYDRKGQVMLKASVPTRNITRVKQRWACSILRETRSAKYCKQSQACVPYTNERKVLHLTPHRSVNKSHYLLWQTNSLHKIHLSADINKPDSESKSKGAG